MSEDGVFNRTTTIHSALKAKVSASEPERRPQTVAREGDRAGSRPGAAMRHDASTASSEGEQDLLYSFGISALRDNQNDVAAAYLRSAAGREPGDPLRLIALSEALNRIGCRSEAIGASLRAIQLAPTESQAYGALAHALASDGYLREAIAVSQIRLRLDVVEGETLRGIGDLCVASIKIPEAITYYERALRLEPGDVKNYLGLGRALLAKGDKGAARHVFEQALRIKPDDCDVLAELGRLLLRIGQPNEAIRLLCDALALQPRNPRVCQLLVSALELLGCKKDAVSAWCNLGAALQQANQMDAAARAYERAVALKADCLTAHVNLGNINLRLARPETAIRNFETALAIDPAHLDARLGLGWAALRLGDVGRGCRECAQAHRRVGRRFEQPQWTGEAIKDQTILLWADFALGDTVQCLRYVGLVKGCGARVVVECDRRIASLVRMMGSVDRVVARDGPLPAFDVQTPLFSLPYIVDGPQAARVHQVPYLRVDEDLRRQWSVRDRRPDELNIGIVWAGSDAGSHARHRAIPLGTLVNIARGMPVRLFSLQLGRSSTQILAVPPDIKIECPIDHTCSIADTAALMLNLDLIVTVDTMTAHLAGALAVPVWTLVSYSPAWWLWPRDTDTSIWYPTMRLFRQTKAGNWRAVVDSVRAALVERCSEVRRGQG